MNAPLSPRAEQFINERVQSGSYKSASEVIEDALDALAERETFRAVRAELDHADAQLACGEFTEYDENGIGDLVERVKTCGQTRLAGESPNGTR